MKSKEIKYIAGISIVMVVLLLSLRIWAADTAVSFVGPTQIRMGQNGIIYTLSDNIFYLHDQDGDLVDVVPLNKFGVDQFIGDFWVYKSGDILMRREVSQKPSASRELEMYARLGSGDWARLEGGESILQRCSMDTFACSKFGEGEETFGKITTFKLFVDEDSGYTYVADTLGHQLLELDAYGVVSRSSRAIFKFPNQILLEDGLLYTADTNNHRIVAVKTTPSDFGIIEKELEIPVDSAISGLAWPMSMAHAPDGNWWVINAGFDMRNGDLVIYDNQWEFVNRVELPDGADPMSLLVMGDKILVTDPSLMRIYTIGFDGRILEDFGSNTFKFDASAILRNKRLYEGLSSLSLAMMIAVLLFALIMAVLSRRKTVPQADNAQTAATTTVSLNEPRRKYDISKAPANPPARSVMQAASPAAAIAPAAETALPDAPDETKPEKKRTGILAILAGIGAIAFKFKGLLLLLLTKLKPMLMALKFLKAGAVLKTGLSMIVSMWAYALAWGWLFAAGFVLLIFVHEMGHAVALRHFGVKSGAPIFIPFVGAFIAMKELPKDARIEAWAGIAGPLLGTVGALLCWAIAMNTGSDFWRALAYTGFFINLFNLIPLSPLDGGRTVAAISPKLWIVGFIAVLLLFFRSFNPLLLIILIPAGKNVAMLWKKKDKEQEQYYSVDAKTKIQISALYFGLIAFLAIAMTLTHVKR